uniref:BTB domain-containing protein n=1 Tax=Meloidogyne hapla TaxID=6305 RepID=A0A1I8B754_MELHA
MEALSPDQNNFRHLSKVSSLSSHFSPSSSSSSSPCGFDSSSDVEQRLQNNNLVGKRFYVSRVETPIFQQKQPENKENGKNNNIIEFPDEIKNKKLNSEIATNNPNTRISDDDEELITFRYTWPVKITERLISLGETAILNVSPPFCTAYNGVQFTWLLRICEENILDIGGTSNDNTLCNYDDKKNSFVGKKKVNITLYYKDGPARDVRLHGGEISILNSKGLTFEEMPLRELEYIKGGGWSPIMCVDNLSNNNTISADQLKFIEFIHSHVGRHISVRIKLEMPVSLFQPLQYLPSIDSPLSDKLEALCAQVLEEIRSNQLKVPDVEFFDPKADKYALYRHVYLFACQVIFERFADDWEKKKNSTELKEKISNIFAHYYFNKVIVTEAECFEDFLEALDASMHVQFPALRRECERYICAEVIAESTDLSLAKKMLVLAARFNLTVLKMVSFGVIVDRLLLLQDGNSQNNSNSNSPIISDENTGNIMNRKLARASEDSGNMTLESSMDEIREELLEIAEKINVDHNSNYHLHSSSDNIENSKIYQNQQHKQLKFRRQHSNSLCSPTSTVTPQFPNITKSTTFLSNSALLNDKNNEEENEEEEEEEDDSDEFEPGNETLVGTVVAQLEQMARYIRKVSMPPGTSPAPLSAELINQNNNNEELIIASSSSPAVMNEYNNNQNNKSLNHRRSSLMTCREMLLQQNQQKEDENTKGITKEENATNFFSQLYAGTKLNNNTIVNSDCNSEHLNERQQHKCSLNEDNKNNSFNKLQHTPRAITISNKVVVIDEVSVCSEEIRRRSSWKNEDDEGVDVFEEDND